MPKKELGVMATLDQNDHIDHDNKVNPDASSLPHVAVEEVSMANTNTTHSILPQEGPLFMVATEIRLLILEEVFAGLEVLIHRPKYRAKEANLSWTNGDGSSRGNLLSVSLACRQLYKECQIIIPEQALFEFSSRYHDVYLDRQYRARREDTFIDTSKQHLDSLACPVIGLLMQNVQQLKISILLHTSTGGDATAWLRQRRKECFLFSSMPNLKGLSISVHVRNDRPLGIGFYLNRHVPISKAEVKGLRGLSNLVYWLVKDIPKSVKLIWTAPRADNRNCRYVSKLRLQRLEGKHEAARGTSMNNRKRLRQVGSETSKLTAKRRKLN